MDDQEVSAALSAMLLEPVPVSAVDLTRAREAGRGIRRRRRNAAVFGSAAGAVLTVAVVAGSLVLTNTIGGSPAHVQVAAAPTAAASTAPATPSVQLATDPAGLTGTDPAATSVSFGWLPAGAKISDEGGGPGGDSDLMALIGTKPSGAGIDLSVSYGAEPPLINKPGGAPSSRIAAPDVNGHHAYWMWQPRPGAATSNQDVTLRWQFAPNGWANLEVFALSSSQDFASLVYQIADGVTIGQEATDIPMPFHIDKLPTALANSASGGFNTMPYTWGGTPGSNPDYVLVSALGGGDGQSNTWTINAEPFVPGTKTTGSAFTQVDGYPAELNVLGLTVFDVDGMTVNIRATGTYLTAVNAAGGYSALFNQLTLLGTNQANWTTHVVG